MDDKIKDAHAFTMAIWQFYKRHVTTDPIDFSKVVEEGTELITKHPDKLRSEMVRITCELIEQVDLERQEAS